MRNRIAILSLASLALAACAPKSDDSGPHTLGSSRVTTPEARPPQGHPNTPTSGSDTIAIIQGRAITRDQLQEPIFRAFGLRFVMYLAKLELAMDRARLANQTVTNDDIAKERQMTLDAWFDPKKFPLDNFKGTEEEKREFRIREYERLLPQFLDANRVSMPEFDIAVQTSAYIRKVAESQITNVITEDHLKKAFGVYYGEKISIRHIQVNNAQELTEATRRLKAGVSFEDVARALSRAEISRNVGGQLPPFSRADQQWPEIFIQTAFALEKPGDISDPVKTGDAIHLIKLVERIPPTAVRFEDHREAVRTRLHDALLQVSMRQLHEQLSAEVTRNIRIEDPFLRKQYQQQLDQAKGDTHSGADHVKRQLEIDRGALTRPALTRPALTRPADDGPALSPQPNNGRSEVARPPATRPGL